MEQKNYKLEIINHLLKQSNHVRRIAKTLNTNHMMVSRKIKELLKENVVDYSEEGKNKVFSLKKTEECRAYLYMCENYKLIQTFKKYPTLKKIINNIQKNKAIKLAVMFGSYAKRIAKKESDIDIYIDTEDKTIKKELNMIDSRANIKIGKYDKNNLLIKEIEKNHVIIKGFEEFYEKNEFFS